MYSHQILLGRPGSQIGTSGFERPDQGDQLDAGVALAFGDVWGEVPQPGWPALSMPPPGLNTPLPSVSGDPTARRDKPASDHAALRYP
ncbi:hypothetical protein ACFY04_41960 [Streptomyces sp. NPDC001549]|uniref:hypothetical protein n=1 Tax=Streptomyces sp. NPDC001549 TaxID=3364586 RepID=UPI0036A2D9C7